MYFWHQKTGGEDAWLEALSVHRAKVISETKPAFVTILNADSVPEKDWGREEYAKMKYSGPLYFDWDSDDIAETIPPFLEFLAKLEENGVNIKCLRLYATGGRGFHIEIPEEVFIVKPPKGGTTLLPYIFKEMALELVVDTMDMRVYTGRKGRMWRTPGVERIKDGAPTGRYKVSITLDEALGMTPDLYVQLTSAPRDEMPRATPEISTFLAAMFAKAQNKVDAQLKLRAKGKQDEELLARHNGAFPPTVARLMNGENILSSVGFQRIAMQLAITANALNKSGDDLIKACEGLIQNHQGDSQRYNSPRKRKEELLRMWDYTHDNPCYGYSRGGIKSLCAPGTNTSDLDSAIESVGVGTVPEGDEDDEALPKELQDEIDAGASSLLEGMILSLKGIHKRTPDGVRDLSNVSFRKPSKMVDSEDGLLIGIEAQVVVDEKFDMGRQLIELPTFASRANLSKFCSGRSGVFSGSDTQAGVVQLNLSRSARKAGRVIYIVRKEGLDVIQNPTVQNKVQKEVIWAAPQGVICNNTEVKYAYQPKVANSPVFKTDIHLCATLGDTQDTRLWLHSLLSVNSPVIVAQMLGWFVSCFHKQFYQAAYQQFPLLHPNGPAGSGKTLTTLMMTRLFHVTTPPVMLGCSPNSSTPFTLKGAWTSSASIPLILDEYKPSEIGQARWDFLLQHFRMLYNQSHGASGGINRGGSDTSFRDITQYNYSAPTAFLGESQEMQTAIVQRSLPIAFNPSDSAAHTLAFEHATAGVDFMPMLGALLLRRSLCETTESRKLVLDPIKTALRGQFDRAVHDRQVFNLAVVLAGLDYLDETLATVFGDEFKDDMAALKGSIYDHRAEINVGAMSEASKVLNDMSLMSRSEDSESEFCLREGYEYIVGDGYMEILMRESFVKYFAWAKRKGFTPLYMSQDAFISAMAKSPTVTDKLCLASKLRTSGQARIFRFNLEKMVAEGIEEFKSKSAR